MELQRHLQEFEAAGIAVFSVSYDSVEVLAGFAEEHGIRFPLLSDEGSSVIKRFGILNTLIRPEEDFYGIPFPGSYLVDEQGRIVEKVFRRRHQVRDSGVTVLRSGFDVPVDLIRFSQAETTAGAAVSAALGAAELTPFQRVELYVRIDLAAGRHVYGREAPDGYFATEVTVTGPEGLAVEEPRFPPTRPFRVEGIDEQFQVLDGEIEIAVPLVSSIREGESVPIDVEVRYQACDDYECYLPQTERLHLDVPLGRLNSPARR